MYRNNVLFPYADGYYSVIPAGLPERFYPIDSADRYEIGNDVLCFKENTSEDIKQRLIKDYTEHYEKEKALGIFR